MESGDVDHAPTRLMDVRDQDVAQHPRLPWPDRAGDQLAQEARNLAVRARRLNPDQRGVAGAVASIVLFLVLLAILGHV